MSYLRRDRRTAPLYHFVSIQWMPDMSAWLSPLPMASAIYSQHTEGDGVMRWIKVLLSALAIAICLALLSMLDQPNFEITYPIMTQLSIGNQL